MAYYRMSGSSKGELHGASVLVTVDGEITSGDTVTLSATGYSQTKTLSDVKTALFTDILDSGTYTATYKTYTNTVDVSAQDVLDKTTKNVTVATSTTITLTIEGAKEDNIKIYDSANTQVASCVFASGQTTGTVDLEIPHEGVTYKFESTVAKDTETGTSNYSKNVSLTKTSSSVKCMPEGALYWYGNNVANYKDVSSGSGYTIDFATDHIYLKGSTTNTAALESDTVSISSSVTMKAIIQTLSASGYGNLAISLGVKSLGALGYENVYSTKTMVTVPYSPSSDFVAAANAYSMNGKGGSGNFYAIWYE